MMIRVTVGRHARHRCKDLKLGWFLSLQPSGRSAPPPGPEPGLGGLPCRAAPKASLTRRLASYREFNAAVRQ